MRKVKHWIDGFMEYTDNTEPPDSYREWVAVSVIAAHLQRKCFLELGDLLFYPNMYIVLVGPPGKCRKGTIMSVGAKFMRKSGIKMAAESVTREALIRELSETQSSWIDDKTGDVNMHASLTVYSQELTVFLGQNNLALMMDLTDWFDCRDHWTYRTKNMGTDNIFGVWVNLIGATTPELIQSTLPRDAIGGGLASRIIFVYEEKKKKQVPMPLRTDEEKQLFEDLLSDLGEISMLHGSFRVTRAFIERYIPWYLSQENHPLLNDPNFAAYTERRAAHLLKLSMIMSAAGRDDMVIDVREFESALALLTRVEKKMPRTFGGYGAASTAQLIHNVMTYVANRRIVVKSDLLDTFKFDFENVEQFDKMMDTLKQIKFMQEVINGDGITTYKHIPPG